MKNHNAASHRCSMPEDIKYICSKDLKILHNQNIIIVGGVADTNILESITG